MWRSDIFAAENGFTRRLKPVARYGRLKGSAAATAPAAASAEAAGYEHRLHAFEFHDAAEVERRAGLISLARHFVDHRRADTAVGGEQPRELHG